MRPLCWINIMHLRNGRLLLPAQSTTRGAAAACTRIKMIRNNFAVEV